MKLINHAEKFKQMVLDQRHSLVREPNSKSISGDKNESLEVLSEVHDLLKDIKTEN